MAVGVVGCGRMGRLHARAYSQIPAVKLAGVYDANLDSAKAVADEFDTGVFETIDAMMDAVQHSGARLSATELMQPVAPKRKPTFTQRLIHSGFVQRTYTAVRERMAAYQHSTHQPQREGLSLG